MFFNYRYNSLIWIYSWISFARWTRQSPRAL